MGIECTGRGAHDFTPKLPVPALVVGDEHLVLHLPGIDGRRSHLYLPKSSFRADRMLVRASASDPNTGAHARPWVLG